jgi:isopentenyldiphosphate isomerase
LKPALIESILCVILGVSVFSSLDIVGTMTRKYMKGVEMNKLQEALFRRNLRNLFYLVMGHTALVFYSAFFMGKEAWAFISGGLFYLLFAIYFVFEYFKNRKSARNGESENPVSFSENEEWLPIVHDDGKIIGKAPRSMCHKGDKILHPVVHLHVLNHKGYFFLQKRPMEKLVQPGKWDTAVGGHISYGEDVETALRRESFEEIGLENFSAKPLGSYRWDTEIESELVFYFVSYDFRKIRLHSDEVTEGKFWSTQQIEKHLGQNIFTPNFEFEFQLLKKVNIRSPRG